MVVGVMEVAEAEGVLETADAGGVFFPLSIKAFKGLGGGWVENGEWGVRL